MPGILHSSRFGTAAALWSLFVWGGFDVFGAESRKRGTAGLIASSEPGWPQFRGLRRDGRSEERGLLQSWPNGEPRKAWSAKELGRGYSSPIVVNGKIYLTGDVGDELQLFCLTESKGELVWKARSGASWKDPYPGARATPTYSAGRVYLQNAHGEIRVFDAETGKVSWSINVLERFGGNNITWGLSECLLVDERAVYATVGGREALVVALDKGNGEVLWKSKPVHDSARGGAVENASYVSPILVNFDGRRLLIGCSLRHIFCVDATTGEIQWTHAVPTAYSVIAMMPVLVGKSIFMTAPHGKPGGLYELIAPQEPHGKVGYEQRWETPLDTCQGGVVYHDGKLIGSFYPGRKGWAAVDAATGAVVYRAEEIVKGAVLYADDRFYVLSENGWMRLLEAEKERFAIRGEFRLAEAKNDAWAHPVIFNKRLYLRYQEELRCYDVAAE